MAQNHWHFCKQGDHDSTGSFDFHVPHDVPEVVGSQKDWRYCNKCHVMFYGPNPGKCVAGGGHDGARLVQLRADARRQLHSRRLTACR